MPESVVIEHSQRVTSIIKNRLLVIIKMLCNRKSLSIFKHKNDKNTSDAHNKIHLCNNSSK